jgi:hypothetical protein
MNPRRIRAVLSPFTIVLLILWLGLAGYFITHPDPISIIALVVGIIISASAILASYVIRNAPPEMLETGASDGQNGQNGQSRNTSQGGGGLNGHNGHNALNGRNGRHPAGAQDVPRREGGEIPEEGGNPQ